MTATHRRAFLRAMAGAAGVSLLAACAPAVPGSSATKSGTSSAGRVTSTH